MSKNKIPSLINGSTGVPEAAVAGKRCLCRGCDGSITKGEKCFDIPNPRKAFGNSRRFCQTCFVQVLTKTKIHVSELEQELRA
jgi:hypothetical protein